MALNQRQERAYVRRFKVYRSASVVDPVTKKRTPGAWAFVGEYRGLYGYTQNDDDAGPLGRVKRRSALTEDKLECEVSVPLLSQDMVVDTSLNLDGSHGANYGVVHRVMGEPRLMPDEGQMRLNYLTVQLMSVPANIVPAGVTP